MLSLVLSLAGLAAAQLTPTGDAEVRPNLCVCTDSANTQDGFIDCPIPVTSAVADPTNPEQGVYEMTLANGAVSFAHQGDSDLSYDISSAVYDAASGVIGPVVISGPTQQEGDDRGGDVPLVRCSGVLSDVDGSIQFESCETIGAANGDDVVGSGGWVTAGGQPLFQCELIEFRCLSGSGCFVDSDAGGAGDNQNSPRPLGSSAGAFVPSLMLVLGLVAALF